MPGGLIIRVLSFCLTVAVWRPWEQNRNSLPGLRIIPATPQGAFATFPQITGQAPSGPTPGLWHQASLPRGDPFPPWDGLLTFFLVWDCLLGQRVLCFGCHQATDPPGEGKDGETEQKVLASPGWWGWC